MTIKPQRNTVFLIAQDTEQKTAHGIIIPDTAEKEKKTATGVVSHIGPDVQELTTGDIVLFEEYGFEKLKIEGEEYLVGPEDQVLCIVGNIRT
jgi:chaperonin GroES